MPKKKPAPEDLRVRIAYKQTKEIQRKAKAARRAFSLAMAEKHPDLHDQLMAEYDKQVRKRPRKDRVLRPLLAPPVSMMAREALKKRPRLPRREET
jgi:hypothetical protein